MTPSIKRRLACLVYESLLLLAILLIASFPFAGLGEFARLGTMRIVMQCYLALVVAAYFCWFWCHGGQTLAMKTWRITLTSSDGKALTLMRCLIRLAWATLAYLPAAVALLLLFFFNQRIAPIISMWLFLPMIATLWWARFDSDKQFLHDRLAKTRLQLRPV